MTEEFKPYKTDRIMGDCYKHPTFGIISFSRTQCSVGVPMFGSSILHSNTIRLEISHAELSRGLNEDRIFDTRRIVEVEMSPTQFADAITSLNIGCGIPVTLRWIAPSEGEDLSQTNVPYQNKVQQFNNEFSKDMKQLAQSFDEVLELATETKAQKRLVDKIKMLRQHISSILVHARNEKEAKSKITLIKGDTKVLPDLIIKVHDEFIYSCTKIGTVKIEPFYVYSDDQQSPVSVSYYKEWRKRQMERK